jgi:hypothetical protein
MRNARRHSWHQQATRTARLVTIAAALSLFSNAIAQGIGFGDPTGEKAAAPIVYANEVWSPYPSEEWSPYPSEPWSPYPSEKWSPYPSEAWSPRVAQASPAAAEPNRDRSVDVPSSNTAELFSAPQSSVSHTNELPPFAGPPLQQSCESHDTMRVPSYFLPSLGRFGIVAPRTPGVDSVHSKYLIGPVPWGAGDNHASLFDPPGTHATGHCEQPTCTDWRAQVSTYSSGDFTPDPLLDHVPYEPCAEQGVYAGKHLNPVQRPLVELGVPLYLNGPVPPPSLDFGVTNPSLPRFYLYGDYRAAAAYNDQGLRDKGVLAHRINLEWDYWLTATERFHMSTGPFQEGNDFMRFEFDDGRSRFINEFDFFDEETDALFFEGDLGYIVGGMRGTYAPFDLPFAAGLIPLLFQNGVWMEDTIAGVAVGIPARNSPLLDWSNFDVTFFAGVDQVTSPAFAGDNSAAGVFGATTFIEAKGGYAELGYAFLDDQTAAGRSYHNLGLSYTRRYLNLVSNSMRAIVNAGQDGPSNAQTADGLLLLAENSFLTPWPYNVIPYVNLFAGFDNPQSVARAGAAGGVLRNTGILFESDNLTGYPTLDATGNDVYGAAVGVDLLAPDFSQQLILEAAILQRMGNPPNAGAPDDQYGLGVRYQIPITNAHLLRFDAMHGWLEGGDDISGARAEYRWKF